MAVPGSKESRLFYRCAKQRYEAGTIKAERADSFIGAARVIIHWADTRLE
jgi:hypothetical protein